MEAERCRRRHWGRQRGWQSGVGERVAERWIGERVVEREGRREV